MVVSPIEDVIKIEGYSKPTRVLAKDKRYLVYATEEVRSAIKYFIMDDQHDTFPVEYDSRLFRIIDSEVQDWATVSSGWGPWRKKISSFPEWANDLGTMGHPGFYERLVDSDPGSKERIAVSNFTRLNKRT